MFEINFLQSPGLQGVVVDISSEAEPGGDAQDDNLIDRLALRNGEFTAPEIEVEGDVLPTASRRPWAGKAIAVAVITVLAFWSYNSIYPVRRAVDDLLGRNAGRVRALPARQLASPLVMQVSAAFLQQLPEATRITYFEAGAGLVLYRIEGGTDIDHLSGIQATLTGFKYGDVLSITGERAKKLVGAITYHDKSPADIWRPKSSAYDLFFTNLEQDVNAGGGEVRQTSSGSQTPAEYVIAGDMRLIRTHLELLAAEPTSVSYHRVILLENSNGGGRQYLLKVVFDLMAEGSISQPQLSRAGTRD